MKIKSMLFVIIVSFSSSLSAFGHLSKTIYGSSIGLSIKHSDCYDYIQNKMGDKAEMNYYSVELNTGKEVDIWEIYYPEDDSYWKIGHIQKNGRVILLELTSATGKVTYLDNFREVDKIMIVLCKGVLE